MQTTAAAASVGVCSISDRTASQARIGQQAKPELLSYSGVLKATCLTPCLATPLLPPALQTQVGLFLAGLVGFNLVASLLPNSGTFKRTSSSSTTSTEVVGPLQDPTITLLDGPKRFFGVTDWGFTPQNELFAGRLASLGIVAAILGELATGLGPVGQLSAGEAGRMRDSVLHSPLSARLSCWQCIMTAAACMPASQTRLLGAGAQNSAHSVLTASLPCRLLPSLLPCFSACRDGCVDSEHLLCPGSLGVFMGLYCCRQAGNKALQHQEGQNPSTAAAAESS